MKCWYWSIRKPDCLIWAFDMMTWHCDRLCFPWWRLMDWIADYLKRSWIGISMTRHPWLSFFSLQWYHMSPITVNLFVQSVMHFQSMSTPVFIQKLVKANIKENIKPLHYWSFMRESTSDQWIPFTKGQWCRKHFQVLTSSCMVRIDELDGRLPWMDPDKNQYHKTYLPLSVSLKSVWFMFFW